MMKTSSRLQKLRQSLREKEIDALLIGQPENRRYLSGFDGTAGFLLITGKKAVLATDFRYIEQSERQSPDYEIFKISANLDSWFPGLVDTMNIKRLGFEAEHVSFALHRQLNKALKKLESPPQLLPVTGLVESLRAIKEPEEIELTTRAASISDRAFEYVANTIHAGMSEIEIAWELEKFLHENGSHAVPFEIIVASGPNSALPHARPSQRAIISGEPVLIDMGASIEGYSSDLSRTICLGAPDDTFKKVYRTVLDAQLAAVAIIKEGITGAQADSAARTIIEQAGYGEAFGHSLGHGIGLAPHESPRLGACSTEVLASGMVFSIEPGIYLPGWGGVRIEDLAIIADGKIKIISEARKG